METKFNFKSQICTTREQSERLLALGLKKETADMCWTKVGPKSRTYYVPELAPINMVSWRHTPAWSLHRLLSMLPDDAPKIFWILDGASITIEFEDDGSDFFPHKGDIYEGVVNCIEWLIKEGYFNKEYLV